MRNLINIILLVLFSTLSSWAQQALNGRLLSQDSIPIEGASIRFLGNEVLVVSDEKGEFTIKRPESSDTLLISVIGYETLRWPSDSSFPRIFILLESKNLIEEVNINTGYYQIPTERSAGSFYHVDEPMLNRNLSTNIIERLEGITNGLHFDRRTTGGVMGDDHRSLRLRGAASISGNNEPLIVLDNFPYEGDINQINPNDIASITILRDASAASIWGAKAGNGIIVITSKSGVKGQRIRIGLNTNITLGEKPDLFYNPNFMSSAGHLIAEKIWFSEGAYTAYESDLFKRALSPAVELFIAHRDGIIDDHQLDTELTVLSLRDVRHEASQLLYQRELRSQNALNISGGNEKHIHYTSFGFDNGRPVIQRDRRQRVTINTRQTLKPLTSLEYRFDLAYSSLMNKDNGMSMSEVASRIYPYMQLMDNDGNPMDVVNSYRSTWVDQQYSEDGLDWYYRPLQERELRNRTSSSNEFRTQHTIRQNILKDLHAELTYQYQWIGSNQREVQERESYWARYNINRFTSPQGESMFPDGSILNLSKNEQISHSGRFQLSYAGSLGAEHHLNGMAGAELRQVSSRRTSHQWLGYDDEVLTYQHQLDFRTLYPVRPFGSERLPVPNARIRGLTDRFIAYYANASYSYLNRYTLSGSSRWDASNLFGVATNQKGVPLWSLGVAWTISNESFLENTPVSFLKLRTSYGYNGNVDKSIAAFPYGRYSMDPYTALRRAEILYPGNPELRWERIGIYNVGLDFGLFEGAINGSAEFYQKKGLDLIGNIAVDPTTGFSTNRLNYASTHTHGVDIKISINPTKERVIHWTSLVLFSYLQERLLDYRGPEQQSASAYLQGIQQTPPVIGKPLNGLYSIPWVGLDSQTGNPIYLLNGNQSMDYSAWGSIEPEQMIYHGMSIPPLSGSFLQEFSWKELSFSVNLLWKGNYYFRRNTVSYSNLFNNGVGHRDFGERWKQPGDERLTNVPSLPSNPTQAGRDAVYQHGDILVSRADNIRIQDIRLTYQPQSDRFGYLPFQRIQLYAYLSNVGILWRFNRNGLDPDYPSAMYPSIRTYSLGLTAQF